MFPVKPNEYLKISTHYKEIYTGSTEEEKNYLRRVGLLGKPHLGLDIAPVRDKDWNPIIAEYVIIAPVDGIVIRSGWAPGYGFHVRIQSTDSDSGFIHIMGHMKRLYWKEGARVQKGTELGLMGSTGSSSATHLHYEVRDLAGYRVNPGIYFSDADRKLYSA